jgi:glycosyltransferase involved in cell wall biosynthesis
MPQILRILNRLNIGGPTLNVAYLSKHIGENYSTSVLAGMKEPYEGSSAYILDNLEVPYEYVKDMQRSIDLKKDYKAFNYIKNVIKKYKPDIVHTHAAKAGVLGRLAAYYNPNRPKVIVHTYHGNVFDGYFSPIKTKIFLAIERHLASISNAIVAISEQQKYDLVHKYKIAPANKIHVIRLGFDLDIFSIDSDQKRTEFRDFYDIPEDVVVITITGRLTAIKNHSLFIDALKIVRDTNPTLKFKVFIVGDGELLQEIINKVDLAGFTYCKPGQADINSDVIFTSWRKDIDLINAGSDIIALTSLNEGTPVSIIEALASQKAVVCTNVGGVKDVISDGFSGILSEQIAYEFAEKLIKLIVNKELRNNLGINGKQFVMENYSYFRLVKETESLYTSLLN